MEECGICLDNLEYEVAVLSCNHEFHYKCIALWQNKNKDKDLICPFCNNQPVEILNVYNKFKKNLKRNYYDIDLNQNSDFENINQNDENYESNRNNKINLFNCCTIL